MNPYLAAAAALAGVVGLSHSIIGEWLIFSRLRAGTIVPTNGGALLKERHVRILWASWHLVTLFGWALALMLWRLAAEPVGGELRVWLLQTIAVATGIAALVVFYGTLARHPGWLGLLGVAVLTWLGIGR